MAESNQTIRAEVSYRNIKLFEEAQTLESMGGNRWFLPSTAPMPVGTTLMMFLPVSSAAVPITVERVTEQRRKGRGADAPPPGMVVLLPDADVILELTRQMPAAAAEVIDEPSLDDGAELSTEAESIEIGVEPEEQARGEALEAVAEGEALEAVAEGEALEAVAPEGESSGDEVVIEAAPPEGEALEGAAAESLASAENELVMYVEPEPASPEPEPLSPGPMELPAADSEPIALETADPPAAAAAAASEPAVEPVVEAAEPAADPEPPSKKKRRRRRRKKR